MARTKRIPLAGVVSLGCSKNLVDTEYLVGGLAVGGWGLVPEREDADLHRVHIWSLCSHIRALSAHLVVDEAATRATQTVLDDVNTLLHARFGITHTTLQSECRGCAGAGPYCTPVHPGEERVARL